MTKVIFVPQLGADDVSPILARHGFELPPNVRKGAVARWHFGTYYGYGNRSLWIPLSEYGGMATRAFDTHTVKFPARIQRKLVAMLIAKRKRESGDARKGEAG